jgi:predicted dehydrogenase
MPLFPETVLHIGLGGTGQRHLRHLRATLGGGLRHLAWRQTQTTPLLNPDFSVDETTTLEERYDVENVASLADAISEKPDLAVIATPSALHLEPAQILADAGVPILIEKPLSHNMSGVSRLADTIRTNGQAFGIVFQRRFHPMIAKARDLVRSGELGRIQSAAFDVSSFVPEWHGYEDFHSLYAVRSDLGGGVLLTEIHEIDLCLWMFGVPGHVFCAGGNRGPHELDVEDTALVALDYGTFVASLDLSFMRKPVGRGFRIDGTEGSLVWRDGPDPLTLNRADGTTQSFPLEDSFHPEQLFSALIENFLAQSGPLTTSDSLAAAVDTQRIVSAAKSSMSGGGSVSVPAA